MSDRAEFEKWYDKTTNCNYGVAYYVDINGRYCFQDIEAAWQAWQAARAQSGQGAEPVAVIDRSGVIQPMRGAEGLAEGDKLYTHPQPAQQGSVSEIVEVAIDMLEDYARALESDDLDGAGHSTTSCIREVIDQLATAL